MEDSLHCALDRLAINQEKLLSQNLGSFFSFAAPVISSATETSTSLEIILTLDDSHSVSLMNILLPTALRADSVIDTDLSQSACA